jgi:zinc/manganese transport system substrate-binding protein
MKNMIIHSTHVLNRKAFLFCLLYTVLFVIKMPQCQAKNKLNVVTTTTNLESIVKAVGGDHVNVFALSTGKEDPHFIEAKPSYMLKAKNADLWIRVGLELEIGYEGLILEGSRNPRIRVGSPGHLDASTGITPLEVPTQRIDRSMGDVHPLGNPHYWMDPYNGRIMAQTIGRRLIQLDPDHKEDYERNLTAFLWRLDTAMFGENPVKALSGDRLWKMQSNGDLEHFIKDYNEKVKQADPPAGQETLSLGGWLAKLKPFEHSKMVTYHRSWVYFVRRFNLDVVAELEPKPGIPPGPAHIRDVVNAMKSEKVGIIVMEPFYNKLDAEAVAGKTDAKVVVATTAVNGQEEAIDYIALFDNIVSRLTNALHEVSK